MQKIYDFLKTIPKGRVVTYGQIAEYLGDKHLARYVGNVLHVNPDTVGAPCYKVVNREGKLARNFGDGIEVQKQRLEADGIEVADYRVDLDKYRWDFRIQELTGLYDLCPTSVFPVPGHEGGRNQVYIIRDNNGGKAVLRASSLDDRSEADYIAETDFIHYLARNGAPVADVLPSVRGKYVECAEIGGRKVFVSLFEYAKGMLLYENGYRYRDGAPLSEYFFNTGKTLGIIHRLSKSYPQTHRRKDYFDKYNMTYIDRLIPDGYQSLKDAILQRFEKFRRLPVNPEIYGLVHFDFFDGNYHIDMNTGSITVFDFDNCMNCWYMYDLANLWLNGTGWCRSGDAEARRSFMKSYFDSVLSGYRSETDIPDEMLSKLSLFIDMVLIENIVDAFECAAREGSLPDDDDIEEAANSLVKGVPYD